MMLMLIAHRYDSQGANSTFQAYTSAGSGGGAGAGGNMRPENFRLIGEAKDSLVGSGDQPDFFCVRAQLVFIKKENMSYPACPTCNKKLTMEDTDVWRCEKCDRTYPAPEYRFAAITVFILHALELNSPCPDQVCPLRPSRRLHRLLVRIGLQRDRPATAPADGRRDGTSQDGRRAHVRCGY